jgi:hypothetical protein
MSKIIEDFELLRNHCIELIQNYNTYTALFNEDHREILTKVASTFFSDIAEIMQRDWILQACKLMDPAMTKKRDKILENITIELINNQLKVRGVFRPYSLFFNLCFLPLIREKFI